MKLPYKSGGRLRSLFSFTPRQRRAVLMLLPMVAVITAMLVFAGRPRIEESFLELVDRDISDRNKGYGYKDNKTNVGYNYDRNNKPEYSGGSESGDDSKDASDESATELFRFDPNTVTLQELVRLGFTTRTAAGIIKYRERGKRFEIPEDFATCYGVTIDHYTLLEPYIHISDEFRARPLRHGSGNNSADKGSDDGQNGAFNGQWAGGSGRQKGDGGENSTGGTSSRYGGTNPIENIELFDPNLLDAGGYRLLGFSEAQAAAIIRFRESMGGFRNAEDIARCYVVSDEMMERMSPYIMFTAGDSGNKKAAGPVEINTADSAMLRSVGGIGEVLVVRILDYRARLGGFVSVTQLSEIPGITEMNYERIAAQILVDSCVIQKIDINFADHKTLADRLGNHPYMDAKTLRKILKDRQLKGGWSTIADMVNGHTISSRQAEKLAPYLVFRSN